MKLTAGDTSYSHEEFNHYVGLAKHVLAVSRGGGAPTGLPVQGLITVRDVGFAAFILALVGDLTVEDTLSTAGYNG